MTFYDWVKVAHNWVNAVGEWAGLHQQLAGAAIGFTGVIFILLWNARQSRRSEALKNYQQRTALLAAFYAELAAVEAIIGQALIYMVNENHLYVTSEPLKMTLDSSYMFQTCPKIVYEKNADKLGQLGRKLSHSIVGASSAVAEFEAVISIITSPVPQDLRTRKVSGKDAAYGAHFVAQANDAIARAIADIKQALPKAERGGLIMIPPFEVSSLIAKKSDSAFYETGDNKATVAPATHS